MKKYCDKFESPDEFRCNNWDYLKEYNIKDTVIMIPSLNFMINHNVQYGIDLLNYVSLSSYACAMKYARAYEGFSIDGDYSQEDGSPLFEMAKEYW